MVTISVNRFWLSTPIDRPIEAMMTSVEPRAFMRATKRQRFAREPVRRACRRQRRRENLPTLAISDQAERQAAPDRDSSERSDRRSSPARPKNTGMNSATMRPRNCSSMWRVRIGDSPTRMPATKAPSTVLTPIALRGQRHADHDDQDGGDDRQIRCGNCRWPSGSG